MAEQISYLIIGNGIAGITAAETLRAEEPLATIGIVADDPLPVYYRPALKDYLAGRVDEERLWARPAHFYQEQKVHFLSERIVGIQVQQHAVQTQTRKHIGYEKLLLANGASPARLKCPGSELQGVTTLRTVADYQAVLARLPDVRRVVIAGSGTLALETAESLRARGLEVSHLVRRRTIWSEVLDTTASDLVLQQELRAGVDVQLETEIVEITGERGEVSGVVTSQGKRIRCELVLVAIGIEPNIAFIRASNIFCGRGVQVDKNMRTSSPDIYAAGDVLETSSSTRGGRMRVLGQWYPAVQQARAAAYNMLGIGDSAHPFNSDAFYNATFLYGLDFAAVGVTNQLGYQEIIAEPEPRSYRKVLLQYSVPVGMLSLGERKQALAFKRAIDYRVNLASVTTRLFDADFKLSDWLDAQGVPPLHIGVRKAGDTRKKAVTGHRVAQRAQNDGMPEGPLALNMENSYTQNIPASLAGAAEALLVHITERGSSLHIAEQPLRKERAVIIGRLPGVDLLVNEGSISRQHAEIRYTGDHYELRDYGSLNGTFINEARIEPNKSYILKPNDELRFGNSVKFKFLLRLLDVAARVQNQEEINTDPLPLNSTESLKNTSRQLPAARPKAGVPNPTGRLAMPGVGPEADRTVPIDALNALRERPGLVVMPVRDAQGTNKERAPQIFVLQPGKRVMLGREQGNDILLDDMDVSRRHAEIFPAPMGVYIRDNNSSNGVFINKDRIEQPYRLAHGDRIKLGNTLIFFVDLQSGREQTTRLATPGSSSARSAPGTQKLQKAQPTRTPVEVVARVEPGPVAPTQQPVKAPERGEQAQATVPMKICPQCGLPNMPVARFCARCSALLFTS
ncbi:MAG: hypothetical protein PVS3B1_19250 [Ktedonobacteraceae bacterium]